MSGFLPIIDDLIAGPDNAARMLWLRRCPRQVFCSRFKQLRDALDQVGFRAGLAYVEAELAALHGVRQADGILPETVRLSVHMADINMTIAVRDERGKTDE